MFKFLVVDFDGFGSELNENTRVKWWGLLDLSHQPGYLLLKANFMELRVNIQNTSTINEYL